MRILQVCPHYVPATAFGGVQSVAHSISKHLVRRGAEVRVVTTALADPAHDLDVPVSHPVVVDGVSVWYEPVVLSRYWGLSHRLAHRVWDLAEWSDIVIAHFHFQFASVVASRMARMRRKPLVIFTHGSLNRHAIQRRRSAAKLGYLWLLEAENLKNAAFCVYNSAEELESSLQYGRSVVVPNGIDPESLQSSSPSGSLRRRYPALKNKLLYLFLGRISVGKGLEMLVRAMRKVVERVPDAHLLLVGPDERGFSRLVRDWIDGCGITESVTMLGPLSGEPKFSAFADSDVFVLPSESEGLSVAMLEAMYFGLPVVVTNRCGLWRTIEAEACGEVIRYDESELANAMVRLSQVGRREEMGLRARSLVLRDHTWDAVATQLLLSLEQAIAEAQGKSSRSDRYW